MKGVFKMVGTLIVVAGLVFVGLWLNQHGTVNNTKNIEYILAHCYNNKLIDLQNEIGVQSVDDLKWYYDDHDTIVIEYGKILLKYTLKDFVRADIQQGLNSIFITTKQHPETLKFRLFWNGQEIPEYVKN